MICFEKPRLKLILILHWICLQCLQTRGQGFCLNLVYPKKRVFGVYLMSKNWKEVIIQLGADQICPFMKQPRGCLKVQ